MRTAGYMLIIFVLIQIVYAYWYLTSRSLLGPMSNTCRLICILSSSDTCRSQTVIAVLRLNTKFNAATERLKARYEQSLDSRLQNVIMQDNITSTVLLVKSSIDLAT